MIILMQPPIANIVTKRLLLKPLSMQWKDDIFREFTPTITRFMFPSSPEGSKDTEQFIRETINRMQRGEELVYAILLPETKEFLGCAGLHEIHTRTPELGVWIKESAHGNKYGREAVTALKEWADANVAYDYILYPVDRDNIASRKIPEALGGKVHDEYEKQTPSGKILHTVEYRIFTKS